MEEGVVPPRLVSLIQQNSIDAQIQRDFGVMIGIAHKNCIARRDGKMIQKLAATNHLADGMMVVLAVNIRKEMADPINSTIVR